MCQDLPAALSEFGRKGDPRMNIAVALKTRHPDMTLDDALKAGGFKFPDDYETSSLRERQIYDEDNVSLQQRKNQLNRRIRYAWKHAKTKKNTSKGNRREKGKTNKKEGPTKKDARTRKVSSKPRSRTPRARQSKRSRTFDNAAIDDINGNSNDGHASAIDNTTTSCNGNDPSHPNIPRTIATTSTSSDTTENKRRKVERRDSFLERIMELPGLDDL